MIFNKERKMKTILTLSLFSIFLFIGCDRSSELTSPIGDSYNSNITTQLSDDQSDIRIDTVPIDSDGSNDNNLYSSKLINGETGGEIIFVKTFTNDEGKLISLNAALFIPPGAFEGTVNIEMVIDDKDASIDFYPEMNFTKDLSLNFWFIGIDVQALGYTETAEIDFAYFALDGETEIIESNFSGVDITINQIIVLNAQLDHFSRYGWVRKQF